MDCPATDGWAGGVWRKDVPASLTGRRIGPHPNGAGRPRSGHGESGSERGCWAWDGWWPRRPDFL